MVRTLFRLLLTATAVAQVPLEDARNLNTLTPDTHFRMRNFSSLADWQSRREQLREQILAAAGLYPLPSRNPLNPQIVRTVPLDGIAVETVLIETMPGYYLGGNVYRPAHDLGKHPAVLSPHGHWKHGRTENIPSYSVPALGVNLARQGYVVFAYDMVGYGDTKQTAHDFGGWREQLWSFNPMGLQLWNSMRALDYIQSRDDVDAERIAVTGASGGGSQTIFLAAVDDRVRIDSPVNMVSASMQGGDPCEEAPNLRLGASNVDFAAMMAPRPMLLISCTGDWTRNTPVEEFPAIRKIYSLYGKSDAVRNAHFDARHNYNLASRLAAYRFFGLHFLSWGPAERFEEEEPIFNESQLMAQVVPPGALNYDALFRQWREASEQQRSDPDETRERLRLAFGAEWPDHVLAVPEGDHLALGRPGAFDRVAVRWIPGKGEPAVLVHPDGIEVARRSPAAARVLAEKRPLILAEVFQTGAARARRYRGGTYFLSYNQTDDANRVEDILTVLAYVQRRTRGTAELIGLDDAAIWCTFAAALAPLHVRLDARLKNFSGTDEDFHDRFFVPGIQRAGGLTAAMRVLAGPSPEMPVTDTEGLQEVNQR